MDTDSEQRDLSEIKGPNLSLTPWVVEEAVGLFDGVNVELKGFTVKTDGLKQDMDSVASANGEKQMGYKGETSQWSI